MVITKEQLDSLLKSRDRIYHLLIGIMKDARMDDVCTLNGMSEELDNMLAILSELGDSNTKEEP